MTKEELIIIGRAMAMELYKLEHTDRLTADEAAHLLGCCKKTLYNRNFPHNQYGWSKKAILAELNK